MGKKVLVELSHPFGADMPLWPYFSKPMIDTMHGLAKSGVLTQKIDCRLHCRHPCRLATPCHGARI